MIVLSIYPFGGFRYEVTVGNPDHEDRAVHQYMEGLGYYFNDSWPLAADVEVWEYMKYNDPTPISTTNLNPPKTSRDLHPIGQVHTLRLEDLIL